MPAPTLTNAQLEDIVVGLSALDGLQTKDGFQPFKFSDETVWKIAENLAEANAALTAFNLARKALAKTHGVVDRMRVTPENAASVAAFTESLDVISAKPISVELQKIARSELNFGSKQNQIPASVLAKLRPILE
jgi:hypothetical protein